MKVMLLEVGGFNGKLYIQEYSLHTYLVPAMDIFSVESASIHFVQCPEIVLHYFKQNKCFVCTSFVYH